MPEIYNEHEFLIDAMAQGSQAAKDAVDLLAEALKLRAELAMKVVRERIKKCDPAAMAEIADSRGEQF